MTAGGGKVLEKENQLESQGIFSFTLSVMSHRQDASAGNFYVS